MIVVVKIGGSLLAKNFSNVVEDIYNIQKNYKKKYKLIIVHGGGPQINQVLREMNKNPKYFKTPSGFRTRYTDKETIDVAIMVLGGKNNKRLVEALQMKGINAFGFTGIDGGTIHAKRKEKIIVMINDKKIMKRGEFSGKVNKVDTKLLRYLLENDYLPIIGCLAKSENGEILNVDGDRAASYVANSLGAEILISLTDVKGIYKDFDDENSLIKKIKKIQLQNLMEKLVGGMKKKAYAALEALDMNVNKVIVSSGLSEYPIFNALEKQSGTVITNE
ncbi:MAG: [LysW]-aminoadipate kinase [Promethearchaeati archaeon]